MNVVIVESPAKAKTINKYLGSDYTVLASYGHVRDLPSKDGSVEPDKDFEMHWEVDGPSAKRLKDIADAVKGADRIILATDPDREGEAISWHVLEVLRQKKVLKEKSVQRVVFNAITKSAVTEAMAHPRDIDAELVEAYLARRALDYLVGFTLSPVLWRKLPGARSAGRVQSVALRLVCEREIEIEAFVPREYWSVEALLTTGDGTVLPSRLHSLDGKKLGKFDLANEADAARAVEAVRAGALAVSSVEKKPAKRNPAPPFTTSTLQQEASRKLGFNAKQTMQVAQRLYEGIDLGGETQGLITYMRTDGVQITPEAVGAIRSMIGREFGDPYLPDVPRAYSSKAKNAQEAHEAIRPTDPSRLPQHVRSRLDQDQFRLYELIWKRTTASQMESARLERTTIDVAGAGAEQPVLRATGQVILFDGFLKLYQEGRDDQAKGDGDGDDTLLPPVASGDAMGLKSATPNQHFTEPPPRFSEATLVKQLEELGIGRPSTYASILSVLGDRNYVRLEQKRFHPEDKGRLVTAFLESFFSRYVEYDFTASLEQKLDDVSAGRLSWKALLREFWKEFMAKVEETSELRITNVLDTLNEILGPHVFPPKQDGSDPRACPACADGRLSLKVGRYGAFIGCSNYPECRFTRQLSASKAEQDGMAQSQERVLGQDPETGLEVALKSGRFGPYVQLGEPVDGEKPKRASIPKDYVLEDLTLEQALQLLALPREVGLHPETQKPIIANLGRYGPYIQHDGKSARLENAMEVFSVGINRAVTLLAEAKTRGPRANTAKALKELGEHPDEGGPITVRDGRYGPYVNHGKLNATLPRDMAPDSVSLEVALDLLRKKAEKAGTKKKPAKKKAAAKKPAAKKTAAKKPAAKKTAAKKKPAKSAASDEGAGGAEARD